MFLGTGAARAGRYCLYRIEQGFNKSERLKKELSFKKLFKEGKYYRGKDFSLRVIKNNLGISRLGISVQARLFPKATDRSRVKRLIREFFRRYKHDLNNYHDIIIRPKSLVLAKIDYKQLEEGLLSLFKIAKVLK